MGSLGLNLYEICCCAIKRVFPNTLLLIAAWGCIVHEQQVDDDKDVVYC